MGNDKNEAKKLAYEKPEKQKLEVKKVDEKPKDLAKDKTTYIMKVVHLNWGLNGKNHFYSLKKPEISRNKMGKYHGVIDIWLKAEWIEKGGYKKK